ncbi:MAG: hypothetical protein IKT25_08705, partial [Firmicutes bacterium]|nr:hypothetical protein [Bacillota bacterium]
FEEYKCEVELSDYKNVLAIITFANVKEDVDRLVDALEDIARRFGRCMKLPEGKPLPPQPEMMITPRKAYFAATETVAWEEAKGRISAEMIAPYPPGIPVIYPGERMTEEVWSFLDEYRARGAHLQGPADPKLNTLRVIKE